MEYIGNMGVVRRLIQSMMT